MVLTSYSLSYFSTPGMLKIDDRGRAAYIVSQEDSNSGSRWRCAGGHLQLHYRLRRRSCVPIIYTHEDRFKVAQAMFL